MIFGKITELISLFEKRFEEIPTKRKELLNMFAAHISEMVKTEREVKLNFICTHNSRRSHMGQIWAQTAAEYYCIPNVKCYSGGTEATAFNPKAVKAVREAGFVIEQINESDNPIYLVNYSDGNDPLKCFSKIYSDPFNPQKDYIAVMTCSDADKNCPIVFGSEKRFPIKYDDPKEFDETELEELKYTERFEQIGIEMIFVFSKI